MRADDGNRTRTVSLGICPVRRRTDPDQRRNGSASDRETPLITGVNGTLMARQAGAKLHQRGALFLLVPSIAAISRLRSACQGSHTNREPARP